MLLNINYILHFQLNSSTVLWIMLIHRKCFLENILNVAHFKMSVVVRHYSATLACNIVLYAVPLNTNVSVLMHCILIIRPREYPSQALAIPACLATLSTAASILCEGWADQMVPSSVTWCMNCCYTLMQSYRESHVCECSSSLLSVLSSSF